MAMQVWIFDPELCCSSGVCGPAPDPSLLTVLATVERLRAEGAAVARFQLSRQPDAFLAHPEVQRLIRERGVAALPIVVVNGRVVATGAYPTYDQIRSAGEGA
ncbi:MAG: arsenite efflux transporter metallochaperone ArsD [Thermaerobacter sp.]|nr:arsenite efflux transporter metallochaperone ArsD [Thermaerobacter sp.]MDA8144861.1 arsenite efflux transporter metallochaperone ArsD [Thermaerobacter sp.]